MRDKGKLQSVKLLLCCCLALPSCRVNQVDINGSSDAGERDVEQVEVFYRITQRINRNAYGEATSVLIAWTSGGEEEDRTPDLVIANDALYQLSYFPVLQGSHNNTMVIE